MKIGMITQWYEPETGSAAHPTAIARALRDRGHDLKVLTGFPSYPVGRVHSGYRMSLRQYEVRDRIQLLRVPDVASHDRNALRRALTLTSFATSATAQVRWLKDCDVVLTYLSPATVGLASSTLRRIAGIPYVVYVQDLWPETVTASGFIPSARINRLAEAGIHRALRAVYRNAGGVVALSPSMAATLASRGSVRRPVSIPNWVDEGVFAPAEPGWSPQLPADRKWIMYAGGIGEVQGLDHAVRAMRLLRDRSDIGLAFVGDGVARPGLQALTEELGLSEQIQFLGPRPMTDMPALMAESVAQLVSLRDLPLFRTTIPSKVQASLACGAPVICAVAGDAADLVAESSGGVVVAPESSENLAEAFRTVASLEPSALQAMGDRGLSYYRSHLSAEAGAQRLEQVLLEAAERSAVR